MDITANDMINVVKAHPSTFKIKGTESSVSASVSATKTDDQSAAANSAVMSNNAIANHKDRQAPIGLFDSGVGGLSIYLHLAQQLPAERYVYYADTLNVPYGNRDSEDIEALTLTAVEWLYQQGCKLIVIACNSASAYALETARRSYPHLPIVGLVPALKPAVLASQSHRVAVLATKATLNGKLLNDVIDGFASPNRTKVTKYFDPQLVPWVEAGMPEQDDTAQRLRHQLTLFADAGIDQLVLGCTHYPFFKAFLLAEIAQQQLSIQVVDSGQAIAERVQQLLVAHQLAAIANDNKSDVGVEKNKELTATQEMLGDDSRSPLTFYATKYDDKLGVLIERLLGKETVLAYYSK